MRVGVDAAELVPGDVVLIEAGDRVPADLRLLDAAGLHVDESALTGESVPVSKSTTPTHPEAALADRVCMAYSGTMTTAGQARGLVVATGSATEIGRIGRTSNRLWGPSPRHRPWSVTRANRRRTPAVVARV